MCSWDHFASQLGIFVASGIIIVSVVLVVLAIQTYRDR